MTVPIVVTLKLRASILHNFDGSAMLGLKIRGVGSKFAGLRFVGY